MKRQPDLSSIRPTTRATSRELSELSTRRRGIVIAGMHRSGTSAFARVLGLLGASLPAHIGPPGEDNEPGFWEPLSIVQFDDELLEAAGSSWDDVSPIDPSWFSSDVAGAYVSRALELLEEEFRGASLFVLKDPRICRLLPFWQGVFRSAAVEPLYVLPIRNPLEVASSLKRRDGFATSKSLLLWLEHVISAELWTRGRPRAFVAYQDLLRDWSSLATRVADDLGFAWPRLTHTATAEIEEFLSERHRHHEFAAHELAARRDVATWVKRVYGSLLSLSQEGDRDEPLDVIDGVSSELRDADLSFGPLLARVELDAQRGREAVQTLRGELERLEMELEERRQSTEAVERERHRLETQLRETSAAHSASLEELQSLREEVERQHHAIQGEEERRAILEAEAEERMAAHSWALADLEEFRDALERRSEEARAAEEERLRLGAELAERVAAHSASLMELDQLRAQLAGQLEQAQAADAERKLLAAQLEAKDAAAAESLAELGRLRSQVASQRQAFEVAEAARLRLESELAERAAAHSDSLEDLRRLRVDLARQVELTTRAESEQVRLEALTEDLERAHTASLAELQELRAEVEQQRQALEASEETRRQLEAGLADNVAAQSAALEAAKAQLAAASTEHERLYAELEQRVAAHSDTLRELGQAREQLAWAEARVSELTVNGRIARLRRLAGRLWRGLLPPRARLRFRYASQLGSWLKRPMPKRLGWVRAYFALRRSGRFDYRYYVMRYPDVPRARMNPLMHYIEHGAREGRDPSPHFSTRAYLAGNPELDPERTNPLMHARARGVTRTRATEPDKASAGEPARPDATVPAEAAHWRRQTHTGIDVLCFPIIDWHYRYQRPQQLLTNFAAAGHRVFYVGTKFQKQSDDILVEPITDGVWGASLPGPEELVIYTDELPDDAFATIMDALERFRDEARIDNAIVVVDLPFWAPIAPEVRRRFGWKVVYDCMDDHSGFLARTGSRRARARIEESESRLLTESDAVLATSQLLYDRVRPRARRSLLVPNAADFSHFGHRPSRLALDDEIQRPVIGYYGAISTWFDVEMIEEAARERPAWTFVLIGSTVGADVSPLETLPNVRLFGERPYEEIPSYLHAFDVACIPFKLNSLTRATNPVKFYEYLSAGKPVVSVDLPELQPHRGLYYAASSAGEFVVQVERALREDSVERKADRIAFARENSWSARYTALEPLVRSWFGRATIVILSYDNPEYLKLCLESIWHKTRYPDYDVYVVVNGTDSEVDSHLARELERRDRLHVIRPESNLGFARAVNLAVHRAGESEFVVILNDDVVVTDGWLGGLTRHLDDESIGLVGPVTNWAGNEARIETEYEGLEEMADFAAAYTRAHVGESFDITSLAMYCVAMRRSLFDTLGGLDERFEIGMFEDDDFAMSVREAGLRVVCAEDVFIHHWGRASFSRMDQAEYDAVFAANRRRFEEKWDQAWVPHRAR